VWWPAVAHFLKKARKNCAFDHFPSCKDAVSAVHLECAGILKIMLSHHKRFFPFGPDTRTVALHAAVVGFLDIIFKPVKPTVGSCDYWPFFETGAQAMAA
jgi:hypothetical protein